ncbi:MAG: ABC transporter permease subunit [Oscillospiraceae bacterium]|nr:ABC transporter permease subunit [Oscillospiraceae bacterium]
MKAVFRHELSSYFSGVTGYVFGAFMLLFVGIYMMVYNISYATTLFEYVPGSMCFVYIIIIPILTMRVLAEEKRAKTDQLLYSLPISMTKVVLGKYMAMLCILLIPTLIMCVYPLLLTAYGNVYLPAAFSAIAGFFLLGAALLAIGTFVSSLTESQAVAAGLCFAVMLLNYFLASLSGYVSTSAFGSVMALTVVIILLALVVWEQTKSRFSGLRVGMVRAAPQPVRYRANSTLFAGLFPSIIDELSLFERFYVFVGEGNGGVFDITGVVYFLTVAGFFLFLSVQSMERKRWSE